MLVAVVDVGSNGVRLAICDLSDSDTARNLPVVFQDRAKISIFDALAAAKDKAIPKPVLTRLENELLRFNSICRSLDVPDENVSVFGTEASRSAANCGELLDMISSVNPAWSVSVLTPRLEATYGAMGIASSYYEIAGIAMDLGGGSIQISWVSSASGKFVMSDSAVSLPFGAAALAPHLRSLGANSLKLQICSAFQAAFKTIKLPFPLKGVNLYLSGGGFRGLGCLAMSVLSEDEYYPVPIINGYACKLADLDKVAQTQMTDKNMDTLEHVFRISKRRASQLPGVLVLVQALIQAAPQVGSVYFCQGGVKEGFLYSKLDDSVKSKDPLVTCTVPYARPACAKILSLMAAAMSAFAPPYISNRILPAAVNLLYCHAAYSKDTQATAALTIAVSGSLSGAFGLSHVDRALLGIILCERWGAEVFDDRVLGRYCDLVVAQSGNRGLAYIFWGYYISKVASVLAALFPAGVVDDDDRVGLSLERDEVDRVCVELALAKHDPFTLAVSDKVEGLEKKVRKFKKKYGIQSVPEIQFKINYK